MKRVFDAFAVLCWLQQESGWERVHSYLLQATDGKLVIALSAINVGEIYYRLVRIAGAQKGESFLLDVRRRVFPWSVVPASNKRVWQAARLKGVYRISYADAFAIALAQELNAPLLTGDPEILDLPSPGIKVEPLV
jgi:predicted nucleic acid-binding protein